MPREFPTELYAKYDVDAAIAKLEDENRKLQRALWLARAERAKAIKWHDDESGAEVFGIMTIFVHTFHNFLLTHPPVDMLQIG